MIEDINAERVKFLTMLFLFPWEKRKLYQLDAELNKYEERYYSLIHGPDF